MSGIQRRLFGLYIQCYSAIYTSQAHLVPSLPRTSRRAEIYQSLNPILFSLGSHIRLGQYYHLYRRIIRLTRSAFHFFVREGRKNFAGAKTKDTLICGKMALKTKNMVLVRSIRQRTNRKNTDMPLPVHQAWNGRGSA
jgi:hypothetical protein